jgi:hypothetical protein
MAEDRLDWFFSRFKETLHKPKHPLSEYHQFIKTKVAEYRTTGVTGNLLEKARAEWKAYRATKPPKEDPPKEPKGAPKPTPKPPKKDPPKDAPKPTPKPPKEDLPKEPKCAPKPTPNPPKEDPPKEPKGVPKPTPKPPKEAKKEEPKKHVPPSPEDYLIKRILFALNDYDILGVSVATNPEEVKKVFRKLYLQVHPDKCQHPDATAAFQKVNKAYTTLLTICKKK